MSNYLNQINEQNIWQKIISLAERGNSFCDAETNHERVRLELEQILTKYDQKLEDQLEKHHDDLFCMMDTASKLSDRLSRAKEGLLHFRGVLQQCRDSLTAKCDVSKELWIDLRQDILVHELLSQVQYLRALPARVDDYLAMKKYVCATKCCIEGLRQFSQGFEYGPLDAIGALENVQIELTTRKEQMIELMYRELYRHLHSIKPNEQFYREISTAIRKLECTMEAEEVFYNESDIVTSIAIVIKCLALLSGTFVDAFKERFVRKLEYFAVTATEDSFDSLYGDEFFSSLPLDWQSQEQVFTCASYLGPCLDGTLNLSRISHQLKDYFVHFLLECQSEISLHELMLEVILRQNHLPEDDLKKEIELLSTEFWCNVYNFVTLLLDYILGINLNEYIGYQIGDNCPRSTSQLPLDYSVYFTKRTVLDDAVNAINSVFNTTISSLDTLDVESNSAISSQDNLNVDTNQNVAPSLFTFETSLSNSELHYNYDSKSVLHQALSSVVNPSLDNLVAVYGFLAKYSQHGMPSQIESASQLCNPGSNILLTYLIEAVSKFSSHLKPQVDKLIVEFTEHLNGKIWTISGRANEQLCECVFPIDLAIRNLFALKQAMPEHSKIFLAYIVQVLCAFKEVSTQAYKQIVQSDLRNRAFSAHWGVDDQDIGRLLRSLPNWPFSQENNLDEKQLNSPFYKWPEEIRRQTVPEVEILTRDLMTQKLAKEDLLDASQLGRMALLQNSIRWIVTRCSNMNLSTLPGRSNASLTNLVSELSLLSNTCVLVMHLEIRVHCFYYLKSLNALFFTTSPVDSEYFNLSSKMNSSNDSAIEPLLLDLTRMHDTLKGTSLQPSIMSYLFEGIDQLIVAIFILSIRQVRRIKQEGIYRTCRAIHDMQHYLTIVTNSRQVAFDYAREYFNLFLKTPTEILDLILDRGKRFERAEYMTVIKLLHQNDISECKQELKRLDEILKN